MEIRVDVLKFLHLRVWPVLADELVLAVCGDGYLETIWQYLVIVCSADYYLQDLLLLYVMLICKFDARMTLSAVPWGVALRYKLYFEVDFYKLLVFFIIVLFFIIVFIPLLFE